MTRETKIGLLVGLAFIILFGIILSEKGAGTDDFNTPPMAAYSKPVVEVVPASDVGQLRPSRPSPRAQLAPGPKPAAEIDKPTPKPALETRPVERRPAPALTHPELAPKLRRMLPYEPSKAVAKIPASGPTLKSIADFRPVTLAARQEVKPQAKDTTVANKTVLAQHKVKAGETLGGICSTYYPGRAYSMLKKVMAVNGISDPKRLREGQTLRMPRMEEKTSTPAVVVKANPTPMPAKPATIVFNATKLPADKFIAVASEAPPVTTIGTPRASRSLVVSTIPAPNTPKASPVVVAAKIEPKAASQKWYVVQAKDSLGKIAKHMYGSEKQWKRVFDANKDIIKNPHVIQAGLKIRLPKIEEGLAAGTRVQ